MRLLAFAICLLTCTVVLAQPGDNDIENTLRNWEAAMAKVRALEAACQRTDENKVFQTKDVYRGTVRLHKGTAIRASIHLRKSNDPNTFEHLILSDKDLYEFAPSSKEIRVHPRDQFDNGMLDLFAGMTVAAAKDRFNFELAASDANYHYLRIRPKQPADFALAQLAILRSNSLPRRIELVQVNGNKVTWDFETINPEANLPRDCFDRPALPDGWKMKLAPAVAPRNPGNAKN